MADEDESPWSGDVPVPASSSLPSDPWAARPRNRPAVGSGPGPDETRAPARSEQHARHTQPASSATRTARSGRTWLLVAAAATVATVGALAVLTTDDGSSDDAVVEGDAGERGVLEPTDTGSPATVRSGPATSEPASSTTLSALTPALTPDDGTTAPLPDDETVVPTTTEPDAPVPDLQQVIVGSPPVWTEWTYPVPPALQQQITSPTDVVVITTEGIVHRVRFPSGAARSIDTAVSGRNAMLHVSGDSLLLQKFDSMLLLRPDAPVREVEIGAGTGAETGVGIGPVIPRGDTGGFLVAPNEWSDGGRPPLWLVDADGEVRSLATADDPIATFADLPLQFLPDGRLLVVDAGGTYVVPDTGTPERLSPGLLYATGRRHVIVRECDATLVCEFVVVDLATGERTVSPLDVVERFALYSQGSVSPDGRTMLYTDWNGSRPATLLLDLDTGAVADDELLRSPPLDFGETDLWASDGSGVFLRDGSTIAFLSRDASVGVELDGLGVVASLAVQR